MRGKKERTCPELIRRRESVLLTTFHPLSIPLLPYSPNERGEKGRESRWERGKLIQRLALVFDGWIDLDEVYQKRSDGYQSDLVRVRDESG